MKKSMNNRFLSEQQAKRERSEGEKGSEINDDDDVEAEQPSIKKSKNTSDKRVPLGTIALNPRANTANTQQAQSIELPKIAVCIPPLNHPKRVYKEKEKQKEREREREREDKGKEKTREEKKTFTPSDQMLMLTPPRTKRTPNFDLPYYITDYLELLQTLTPRYRTPANCLSKQPDITPKKRLILLDWVAEVCEDFGLLRETFHIAANLTDRYLSKTPNLDIRKYQLVGTSAIFIAAKLEEERYPSPNELSLLTEGTYTKKEIFAMEKEILRKLDWYLLPVTPMTFLRFYAHIIFSFPFSSTSPFSSQKAEYSTMKTPPKKHFFSSFNLLDDPHSFRHPLSIFDREGSDQKNFVVIACLLDCILLDYESLNYDPSVLAISGILTYFPEYRDILCEISQHSMKEVSECVDWVSRFATLPTPSILKKPVEGLPDSFHSFQYCLGKEITEKIKRLVGG